MGERDSSPTSTASLQSNATNQTDKQANTRAMFSASPSISTPPTSLDDEVSVLSEITKAEQTVDLYDVATAPQSSEDAHDAAQTTPGPANTESRRPARSSRKSVTTYNVQILAGTAIHTPTKYLEKHHKSVLHGDIEDVAPKESKGSTTPRQAPRSGPRTSIVSDPAEEQLAAESAQAAQRRTSARVTDLRKEAFRNLSGVGDAVVAAASAVAHGSLRRSASDSRLKSTSTAASASSLKRPRTAIEPEVKTQRIDSQEDKNFAKPKSKVWLKQGLFVGQHRDFDARLSESQNRARKRARKPRENTVLPLPIFAYDRLLNEDPRHVHKDFKLPFDTYSPLPRKVKVDGWVKLNKSKSTYLISRITTNLS